MAARKRRTTINDKWRARIKTSMLINRLEDHVDGKVKLSPSQVTAALGLLKKTAPDLSAVEHSGDVEHHHTTELTRDELLDIASSGREGATGTPGRIAKPDQVH